MSILEKETLPNIKQFIISLAENDSRMFISGDIDT